MNEDALAALTRVELREAELLSWGAVGAEWTEDELLAELSEHGSGSILLARLLDAALIVRTPSGGFRTRSAETVRLLATLRQSFPQRRVTDGQPLVLDHRFLHRPRRRPARVISEEALLDSLQGRLGPVGRAAAGALIRGRCLSGFQQRGTHAILDALTSPQPGGVMVAAGTGSGKTLAFYLPLLSWLSDQLERRRSNTLALALYPRNELLKDQLRAVLEYLRSLGPDAGQLSVATWFGLTPASAYAVRQGWAEDWVRRGDDFVCPYLRCLDCDQDLLWLKADLAADRERLVCSSSSCAGVVDGSLLRLTRESARRHPANLMFSTTESLNRQLAAPGNLKAFGVRPATLAAVLLDEVHTYEGPTGAQNAILLRRLAHALRRPPLWVGLSATLRNAGDFFAQLVGLLPGAVTVIEPGADELEESGAEYLLALRHDPHSRTGTNSTSIQACMALARCLDSTADDPFERPPSSELVFGSKLFLFTDKLDSTNRLFWDLLDAEGWRWPGSYAQKRGPQTLAHLRGETQANLAAARREPARDRDPDGQWWWLPELLGHGVEADRSLIVGRTSSQDRGVAADAQVVVATATLEVGFDDERVGAVVQHKAPHDAAQFLQRKGRAGRNMITRPWTVVVLSDWGRDRRAWEAYDALFAPELPPRGLPLTNLHVLRIQAVYAFLDWLASELGYTDGESTWEDLAGPPAALYPENPTRQAKVLDRQARIAEMLTKLLRPGPERDRLRLHLRSALGLGTGDQAEAVVDSILWDAPRPLLGAVVPTIRRRLRDQWLAEEPPAGDLSVRTRTPLRQFVPGNLFDDLLVPDVQIRVPTQQGEITVENLPALRTIGEFCPGNVTRHFGVRASGKRHWIPLPLEGDLIDVRAVYGAVPVEVIGMGTERISVYAPTTADLSVVPNEVKDASMVRPDWEFTVSPLGEGVSLRFAKGVTDLLSRMAAHLHGHGGGVRTLRYARTARGTVWNPRPRPVRLRFSASGDPLPAALGVEVQCDALECAVVLPECPALPDPEERVQRLRHRLEVETELPEEMSSFDREALVEMVLVAVAQAGLNGMDLQNPANLAEALKDAAAILGPTSGDNHMSGGSWPDWCDDSDVLSEVLDALAECQAEERSLAWGLWWQRRYTLSTARLVLAALSALCPGVDPEELMIDIDPGRTDHFWITEPGPGGTGQIEAFARALIQDPDAFPRSLEDALLPSSVERMDQELTALLRSEHQPVHTALSRLREAWQAGHAAVAAATRRLDDVADAHGHVLDGPTRAALSTRIAGPGAHPELVPTIVSWLELRDEIERCTRLSVSGRTLGALLADDVSLNSILRLDEDPPRQRRARAVANVLWPWGEEAQPDLSYNPFAPPLRASIPMLRASLDLRPPTFDASPWDDEHRSAVHDALRKHGEILLRTPRADRSVLRAALLDLQTRPIEIGTLLCHPVVAGATSAAWYCEARLVLREAM